MDTIKQTLGEVIEQLAVNYPDKVAMKYTTMDFCKTYKELNEITDKVAKGLLSLGVKKGDHVAIWATNVPEWLLTLFGSAKMGGVLVTVNTSYKIFEVEYLLNQSDTKVLVLIDGFKDCNYIQIIKELCPELNEAKDGIIKSKRFPYLTNVIYAGDNTPSGLMSFKKLIELGEQYDNNKYLELKKSLHYDDVVNMQYTSGTTGFPKGVMLTHFNIINNGKDIGDCMNFSPKDKLCITVPLFHCFGLVLATMASITHAVTMVIIPYFKTLDVLNALDSEQCTAFHGVPTMFIAMLEHPDFKKYKFNLRTGIMAGSPCPVAIMQRVVDEIGMKEITIVFGQTESSPGCTQTRVTDSIELRVNTVGRALPGVECKIVDPETGATLPPHKTGEFCARGYNIMRGYYKMPEATAQAIDKDGWLHFGDLCTVDENGYYKVVGRIKDMIIRGGENIYPKEIEEFLYTYEPVSDVQVIGVPSKQYGEEVAAFIILKKGYNITEQDVKDYVSSHLARHKVPKYIRFVDSFPVTASGKIQKYKMREQAIEIFNLQEAANIVTA